MTTRTALFKNQVGGAIGRSLFVLLSVEIALKTQFELYAKSRSGRASRWRTGPHMRGYRAQASSVMCCRHFHVVDEAERLLSRDAIRCKTATDLDPSHRAPNHWHRRGKSSYCMRYWASNITSTNRSARNRAGTHACINWRIPGYAVHGVRA